MLNSRTIRDSEYMFDTKTFSLSPSFVDDFKDKQPEWGPLGYITFKRTYARPLGDGTTEEFWQTLNRVISGVFTIQKQWCKQLGLPWTDGKAQKTAQKMFRKMWDFKMLAPGRGLWIMGTDFIEKHGSAALNNCFSYETELITEQGVKRIGDCSGTIQRLLTEGGKWVDAPINCFGKQKLMKLTLSRQGKKKIIYSTEDHRWFCRTVREKEYKEVVTKNLKQDHIFKYIFGQNAAHSSLVKPSILGVMHGICYGDGTSIPGGRNSNILQLFEEKRKLSEFFPKADVEEKEDRTIIRRLPNYFRELPRLSENTSYLMGWLMGYFSTDGSVSSGQVTLSSYNLDSLVFVRDLCYKIGIGTYGIIIDKRKSNFDGIERDTYKLTFMASSLTPKFFLRSKHQMSYSPDKALRYWKLEKIEETDRYEDVYCATVENTGSFALTDNILTGNCAFTSTEDIDIKFSKSFEFLMDMSMLGVGVGFDTLGAGKIIIKEPKENGVYEIPDSREGWVESLKKLLDAYFLGKARYTFDFSLVRPEGSPIKGFGGLSAGPDPLKRLLEDVDILLRGRIGQPIKSTDIVDIMNMIGRCVVAGNVRRCLPEGTLIHTKEGLIRIENILPGMLAKTSDGYAEISELIPQGKQKTVAIRTQMGILECTKKHQVAKMISVGEYSWVMAQDLKKGDRLTFIDSGIDGNMIPAEVLGIYENDLEVSTYDISVPSKKEFVCQEGFLVHNSAELALGKIDDVEFMTMKQDKEKLESYRWASNNSILATSNMNYDPIVESVFKNGEPGLIWLENAQKYGRLKDGVTWSDKHAKGVNPCFSGDSKLLIKDKGQDIETPFSSIVGQTVEVLCPYSTSTIKAEIIKTGHRETVTIGLSNGVSFRSTPNHILCTAEGEEIEAGASLGLLLRTLPGLESPKVTSIVPYGEEAVYDFKMDSIHWGFVNGIVAHNCGEQTLESFELCCVSSSTKIQAKTGVFNISDKVGEPVEVWNGDGWSKVIPFIAGESKDLYRVWLSDGSFLDCTDDHGWCVKGTTKRIYKRKDTKELTVGDKSLPFSLGDVEGVYDDLAYEYGLFSGDGYIDNNRPMLCICGDKSKLKDLDIRGVWYKEQIKEGYKDPYNRLSFMNILDLGRCRDLNDKTKGLPEWVFCLDKESILEFVSGLIETDGNVCQQTNSDNYRIFGNEQKIRDLQILLRRVGINHASIYSAGDAGEETNFGIRNYSIYCCYIPSYECGIIPTRLKKVNKIGSRYKNNNAYPDGQKIDAAIKQKVVKVEKLEGKHTVYCFSEPENHMGVFGNVLTYQCLVETFPSRHESYEEFEDTLKMAYLYAKSVTLVNTHWAETNAVMLKNRRMGISQTGIINAIGRHGLTTMLNWCDKGYNYLKSIDELYSAWLCVPLSKKLTTVKPSGTVSLLAGVSAGIHYPHSKHYIRRIRFDVNSEYLPALRGSGYRIEPDVYSSNSVCVEFPIEEPFFTIGKKDVSVWEQLENAGMYQYHWSDNQVSITVTFKESEKQDLKRALEYFEHRLKGVSLLPLNDSGYKQMPYETITEEEYKKYAAQIKPLVLTQKKLSAGKGERFCTNDSCEIKLS